MIYGQLPYYRYELKTWFGLIDFHKSELHELLTQLDVLLGFPLVSLPDAKAANALIDQLIVQEQRFDHIHHEFEHQARRLAHAITFPDRLEPSVVGLQESCRTKMKSYEITFVKTRYECFLFLSRFFSTTSDYSSVKNGLEVKKPDW